MATKKKKVAGSSMKRTSVKSVAGKAIKALTGSKTKGRSRKKKGALWYAKEIQRLKLKKRYEKLKYRV